MDIITKLESTLKDEFDKVAAHNQHHLEQIEAALKRKE